MTVVLDAFAALAIAALSGMGIGSGGLFVIYLTFVDAVPQLAAQGYNLLFFIFSSGASLIIHLQKRAFFWGSVLIMTVFGIVGALLGSFVAGLLSVEIIRKIFGAMLAVSGGIALFSDKKPTGE